MKKILITSLCLMSSLLLLYVYAADSMMSILHAQSAPVFQMPKGSKVVLGKYNNREIVWDIGNNDNNGSYVLMSSKPIKDDIAKYDPTLGCSTVRPSGSSGRPYGYACPNTLLDSEIGLIALNTNETALITKNFHIPTYSDIQTGGVLGLGVSDRAFKNSVHYYLNERGNYRSSVSGGWPRNMMTLTQGPQDFTTPETLVTSTGSTIAIGDKINVVYDYYMNSSGGVTIGKKSLRPFGAIDSSKIMFSANTSYTDGNWHNYVIDTDNLNGNNELNANKLRIQSSLTAFLQDVKYKNNATQKVIENSVVKLSINANTGTNTKISIILYDEACSQIKYYKMLESTRSGTNDYTLDLTGVAVGKYQIAVINEEYDSSSQLPVESSMISDVLPLEIVKPHKLAYTKTPQSGASSGKDFEFSKNVNTGQIIGKITVNPQGIMPLTYTVESNGDNTYQNFEVDGLNNSGASNSTSLDIKIKNNGPDLVNGGLKAGDYKFCVSAVDANGDPTAATSDSKVCTTFTVEKTSLSVAFDDPSTTKKSMTDAASAWIETATATPNTGTKITYSKSGGYSSLIEIDSETGEVIYNGNNVFNKVTIRATADDDPATGDDNYDPAYVDKEIIIYRGVNATLTPDSASSNTSVPTFTASQSNVKGNGLIGTIQGTEGTPDTIGGTQTTYRYEIINGQDSGMFQITTSSNKGTIKVKAGSELGVGSYHFTVRVSDQWSSKDVTVTVNVGVAGAENLQFYETTAAINMISQKSVTVTDTGVTVFATVRGSSNTNPVKYSIQDGSTNVVEVNENTGAITIHGVGTVTIVAEKQGAAGQADAYAELTFTVTAGAQKFIYTDNAGNELPKTANKYNSYEEVYGRNKTFQLYTAGNPTGSTVTYQLKAGSPADVISVDSNGLVHILNASLNTQMGKVIVEATSHDPNGNYTD